MKTDTRIIFGILVIAFVLALGYSTVSNYLEEYKTVSEVVSENTTEIIWVNGTILKGSFTSLNTGEYIFVLTDGISEMNVRFGGEIPSSLGAESDVVILGNFKDSMFYATRMITKCPTKYQG